VLLWLNGPFGVGKTTTSTLLRHARPDVRVFDPELVGYLLRRLIPEPVDDFQDWPAWRVLVAETAAVLWKHYGALVVAPMSLLREDYATEIFTRLRRRGVPQLHVVLHAEPATLAQRIRNDTVETGAVQWRLDSLPRYQSALRWLQREAILIDTTHLTKAEVAAAVDAVLPRTAGVDGPQDQA